MTIAEITAKMIAFSEGDQHDISHFLKVWAYARTIGQLEALDDHCEFILETAAILHDIACPLCRKKYGKALGKDQEREGMILGQAFLKDCGLSPADLERIIFLIGHHHTLTDIKSIDHQILVEADFLVNAYESNLSTQAIVNARDHFFKTKSGTTLLNSAFNLPPRS
ncbi:MAG: HD domain-containing protein [Succinatimonas sp.]|nr:HD domain-containing protein [Succinatimonas sp.]